MRYDKGKLRWSLLPLQCLVELVRVYNWGTTKYADDNWKKGMSWSRVYDPMMRHIEAWWLRNETYDEESGIHHLAHVAWNVFTLLWYSWHRKEYDDRSEECFVQPKDQPAPK